MADSRDVSPHGAHAGDGDTTITLEDRMENQVDTNTGNQTSTHAPNPWSRSRDSRTSRSRSRSVSRPRGKRYRSRSRSSCRDGPRGKRHRSRSSTSRHEPRGRRHGRDSRSRSPSVCDQRDYESDRSQEDDYEPVMPSAKSSSAWALPRRIAETANTYFTTHFTADEMKGLLEELPTPSHDFLRAPDMDEDLKAYFAGKKDKVVAARDANWQHVESKLKRTMGPLGRLWEAADQARKGHLTSVKAEELLRLVEKTALFVGQAAQSVTYYRRTEVLFPVLKEKEEVKKALRNHADKLPTSGKLFGKEFQAAVFKDKTEISDLVALARREEERRKRQQQKQNQQRAPNRSQQGDRSQHQRSSQQSGAWGSNSRWGNNNQWGNNIQPFPAAQSYNGTARRGHGQGPSNRGKGSGSKGKQGPPKPHSG